ncbi:hypothetical protein CHH59_21515 [Shouchella clausii]|uniref:Uncharacterized protein n=1 Tax=Shouchella clausii TaxID=79880 RepID=A0A268NT27_SHOCL|nr:hypothetical protein [Shouchella clausii]PAE86663.1 hypothetical protein CHH72_22325 [Shouchella clausii]PAF11832.1 hypothetical protein CHH59_21515 [Shouchella clausii]
MPDESYVFEDSNESTLFDSLLDSLNEFYQNYVVETASGSFQVFQSFTYGEMAIVFLLLCILFVLVFKWIYEVLS